MAKRSKNVRGPWAVWKLILADVLLLGIALLVFALFHHVLPRQEEAVGTVSSRVRSVQETPAAAASPTPELTATPMPTPTAAPAEEQATPEATATPTPEPTPQPTPDPVGYFGSKFADKFTDGDIIREGSTYRGPNVNVTVTEQRIKGADVYIADIYVRDISCLQSAFGKDTFGKGYADWPWTIAERKNAVITINGDFYGTRDNGVVIRNGVLYRDDKSLSRDVCVLYWDGTMECFGPKEFDSEVEMARGAYQAWNFGPSLLDADGGIKTKYNASQKVLDVNPRAAIGYVEPGHYYMVVADGRSSSSVGLSLNSLSNLFAELGCKAAYNMDGGQTAVMVCGSEVINDQAGDGRQCSDFVMVIDEITTEFDAVQEGKAK